MAISSRPRRSRKAALPIRLGMFLLGTALMAGLYALSPESFGTAGEHGRRLADSATLSGLSGAVEARRLSTDEACSVGINSEGKKVVNLCYPIALEDGGIALYILGVLYLFVGLAIVCDEFFVPALEELVEHVGCSDDVAGATFMAAGGSAPELFTSAVGTFSVPPSAVGFGTIVGSAVFNVLFVIGMCAIFSREVLHLTWWPLARDCSYYIISLLVLAVLFNSGATFDADDGKGERLHSNAIEIWESAVLLAMYGGYVFIMANNVKLYDIVNNCLSKKQTQIVPASDTVTATPSSPGVEARRMSAFTSIDTLGKVDPSKTRKQISAFLSPATFRAGVLQLLISQKGFMDRVERLVISGITGNVVQTFNQIDSDGSGSIDQTELRTLLDSLCFPNGEGKVSDAQVNEALRDIDTNSDSQISLEEFRAWYDVSEHRVRAEAKELFDQIDVEKSGSIWRSNIVQLIEKLGGDTSEEAVNKLWTEAAGSSDAKELEFEAFGTWYESSMLFQDKIKEMKQAAEEEEEEHEPLDLTFPKGTKERIIYLLLSPLTFSLAYTVPDVRNPARKKWFMVTFCLAIMWVGIYSFFMVEFATLIGNHIGINPIVMGLTFLAAGTSIPDLLTSVIVARQGLGDMAVSSSIGSNIFDVLVGLPLPWFLFSCIKKKPVSVEADSLFVSILILVAMIFAVIVTIVLSGWKMTKMLGYVMFILYAVYIVIALIREDVI
jgi:K+-dependent Na+/Ca+ exchanger-like protein